MVNPDIRASTSGLRSSDIALFGVYEISKLLNQPARLESTLANVLQLLSSFLDMRHGLIALLKNDGSPEIVVGSGWSEATAKKYFERLPEQAIGRIVVTKMPLVIERMRMDTLFEHWDFSAWGAIPDDMDWSFIGVPIKDRGSVVGTLTIDREYGGANHYAFDDDVRFLSMIANLLGQTVRLQRLITRDREWLMGEQRRLEKSLEHAAATERQPTESKGTLGIIGVTSALQSVLEKVKKVARIHSPVLLRGESGTGKEMFAEALHQLSPRCQGPFVAVNCAALSDSVLESELFGHEKGAFTGASALRKGRFEMADHGTLFLDEIGEISGAFQAKLLRVLQLGEFERVGGNQTLKVNVRLVAATNRNLEEMVTKGTFRSDLYYRINVVPIFLPPLRERKDDIPLLASEFLKRFNEEHGTQQTFSDSAFKLLEACYFPGNVRELENCVRRTAALAQGSCILADDFACRHDECLSAVLWKKSGIAPTPIAPTDNPITPTVPSRHPEIITRKAEEITHSETKESKADGTEDGLSDSNNDVDDGGLDKEKLIEAMEKTGWVQAKAARLLGLTARQIGYALRKYQIQLKKL